MIIESKSKFVYNFKSPRVKLEQYMLEGRHKNNKTIYFHVNQPLKEKLMDQVNKVIVSFAEAIVRLEKVSQIEEYVAKQKNSNHRTSRLTRNTRSVRRAKILNSGSCKCI